MADEKHMTPCDDLSGFRKMMYATMTVQSVFMVACLSLCVNSAFRVSAMAEKQVQIIERQRSIEQKADAAQKQSAEALAISSRSEANITWIREGLTELKVTVRQALRSTDGVKQ